MYVLQSFYVKYPCGKRDGGICDITWHSVQFTDNVDVPGGMVNKFPGTYMRIRSFSAVSVCGTCQDCVYPIL